MSFWTGNRQPDLATLIKLRILEEDAAFFEFPGKLLGKHRFHSK